MRESLPDCLLMPPSPNKFAGVIRRAFLFLYLLAGTFFISMAQSPQANLDQGNNGQANNTNDPVTWVNGNLNETQNHYIEGQSIPYRAILDRFKIGCETKIRIAFDVRRNGKMAIDYLTSNDWYGPHATVFGPGHLEAVDPLLGLSGVPNTPSFYPLPAPGVINSPVPGQPQTSFNTVQAAGDAQMAIYNGTISNIAWVVQPNYSETNASFEAVIEVTFTATALPVVLSWGGHIASRIDWGFVNGEPRSAGGISGSPYHMRLKDWDVTGINAPSCSPTFTSIGNQDRSLQISAPLCVDLVTTTIAVDFSQFDVNNTLALTTNPSGGFPPYTYLWTASAGVTLNNPTLQSPTATVVGNVDNATFTVTVTDQLGCTATQTRTVSLVPRPCGINGPSSVCPNSLSQFTFPYGGATTVSWVVTGHGSISGSNTGNPVNVAASNVCGGQYIVVVTAVYPNSTVTCSTVVNVQTPPPATFANPPGNITVGCGAVPPHTPLTFSNGGENGCSISGQVAGERSGSFTACGGLLTDSWSFTDLCGRTITHSRTITVSPAPFPSFTGAPGNITVAGCSSPTPLPSTINYTNNGSGDCLLAGSALSSIVLTSGAAPCQRVYTETWTATVCNQPLTHSRTITFPAAPQAAFVNPPANVTVPCSQAPSTAGSNPLSYSNGLTGPCAISGTANSVITGSTTSCGGLFTETWSFQDPCGRGTTTYSRTYTVTAAPAPAFVNPPGNITVACVDVTAVGSLSYTNGGTGGCLLSGTIQGVRTGSYTACGGLLTDTWTIPAPCPGGQPIVHSRTVTVTAAPQAQFATAPNLTISCAAAPPTGTVLAYNNNAGGACAISGTATGVITGEANACGGSFTETWTFTDQCGRTSTRTRSIFVTGAPVPAFVNPPGNITVACVDVAAVISLNFTNGATGGCLVSGTVQGVRTGSYTVCGGTLTDTWTIPAPCPGGQPIVHSRTVTVNAAPQAQFASAPNLTITCAAAPPTGTVLAYTNNAGGACAISGTATGVITGSHNACGGTYTETWTFTDLCQRTSTRTRTITVTAAAQAEFASAPNLTIPCGSAPPVGTSLSFTNGATGACAISGSVVGVITGSHNACGGTYTETWTFTDNCQRTSTRSRTITVQASAQAEFTSAPNLTIPCGSAPPTGTSLSFTNGATGACAISGSVVGVITGSHNACGGTYTETWTFTDACQRTSTRSRTITVQAAAQAEFASAPNLTIPCGSAPPTGTSLSFTNGATGACAISGSVVGVITGSHNSCGGTYTETWTFTDNCQRTSTRSRTITVQAAPQAEFASAPNLTIPCGSAPPVGTSLSFTNGGTGACAISGSVVGVITGSHNSCGGSYTETWTFTDNCQRTSTRSRTITVQAAPLPAFVNPPGNITVVCADVTAPPALNYTNGATGGCLISGTIQPVRTGSYTACGGTLTDTWTIPAPCPGGQPIVHTRTVTVTAAPQAQFATAPNLTISCAAAPPTGTPLSFTNGGTGACIISGSATGVITGSHNACGGSYTETWTFTDACGRTSTRTRTITVTPAALPTFVNPPGNITVVCADVTAAPALNYTNGATGGCLISGTIQPIRTGSYTACGGTLTDTWTIPAPCPGGQPIVHTRTVTVTAAPQAQFATAPNLTIPCGSAPPVGTVLAFTNGGTGACVISGTATGVITGSHNACGGTYTETWTFTDACGRTSTRTRTITVEASAQAQFASAPNLTIPCASAPPTGTSLAFTNNATGACAISGSVTGVITGSHNACGGSYTETWTFTDICGRISTRSRTITVTPAALPTFVNPPGNITVVCADVTAAPALNYTNGATGGCLISGTIQPVRTGSYTACGGTLTDTWTIPAPCPGGQPIVHTRTVTVTAAPQAQFASAPNLTISCAAAPPVGTPLAFTNGGTGACVISGTATGVITGSHNACGGSYTETWTFTDACGRTSTRTRTITVNAAPPAAFVNPPGNITATVCGTKPPSTSLTYTNGGAGNCTISGSVMSTVTGGNSANCGTYTETWTFTDQCGRTITHSRTIEVPCCRVCTLTQGAYGNPGGNTCVDGVTMNQTQVMIDALTAEPGQMKVFGRQDLNRYWVIRLSDVNAGANSNIFKLLPGGGPSAKFGVDNVAGVPEYSNTASWPVVPLQPNGPQAGRIRNQLFSQTLTLYFNMTFGSANVLATIPIAGTYTVAKPTACGSNTPTGTTSQFSLPADVVAYLGNAANGYPNTIAGLFQLANDALGGVNVGVNINSIQSAVEAINSGFDECKILVGTSNTAGAGKTAVNTPTTTTVDDDLKVTAFPNPFENDNFNLRINAPVTGKATIELFTIDGVKITQATRNVIADRDEVLRFNVPRNYKTRIVYKVTIDKFTSRGIVLSPN